MTISCPERSSQSWGREGRVHLVSRGGAGTTGEEAGREKGPWGGWENPAAGTHLAMIGRPGIRARSWEGKSGPSLNPGWDGRATPPPGTQGQEKTSQGLLPGSVSLPILLSPTQMNEHTHALSLPSAPGNSLSFLLNHSSLQFHYCHEVGIPSPLPTHSHPPSNCATIVLPNWLMNLSFSAPKF